MMYEDASVGRRFTVIIVNYNGGKMLAEAIVSALEEGVPAAQIIVVDNGSTDSSIVEAEQRVPGVHSILLNHNTGFAHAVNVGLSLAGTEFLLLLNNDALIVPKSLPVLASFLEDNRNCAAAGGKLVFPDGRDQNAFAPFPSLVEEVVPLSFLQLVNRRRFRRRTSEKGPVKVDALFGAFLCLRASSVHQIGRFDEDFFFYFEEIEWCHRASKSGAKLWFVPDAVAVHHQGATANKFRGPARVEYQRAKLKFFKKTRMAPVYSLISALLVFRTAVNAVSGLIACTATGFLNRRLRVKARTYLYLFAWHLLGRPGTWGLPR